MGISIQGIVTKINERKVLRKLEKSFRSTNIKFTYDIELTEKIPFEELTIRKRESNLIDIYSDDQCSLITFSHEIFEEFGVHIFSKYFDFDYFDLDDTSMAYRFAQFRNNEEKLAMNIFYGMNLTVDDNSQEILGDNFLDIKKEDDIFFNSFHKLVNLYLNSPFEAIDLGLKINRYKLKKRQLPYFIFKLKFYLYKLRR